MHPAPKSPVTNNALDSRETAQALKAVQNHCIKSCGTCIAYNVLDGIPMTLSPSFKRKGRGRVMFYWLAGKGQSDLLAHN